ASTRIGGRWRQRCRTIDWLSELTYNVCAMASCASERLRMPSKKCPACGLYNPETAVQCDCSYHFQSGQSQRVPGIMPPHGAQRRRSAFWLATLTILYTVSLVWWPMVWTIIGITTAGYVGYGGPHPSPIANGAIVFLSTLAYPFVVIMGLACDWLLYSRQRYRAAFWVSLIPLAHILLVLLSLALLSRVRTGHL